MESYRATNEIPETQSGNLLSAIGRLFFEPGLADTGWVCLGPDHSETGYEYFHKGFLELPKYEITDMGVIFHYLPWTFLGALKDLSNKIGEGKGKGKGKGKSNEKGKSKIEFGKELKARLTRAEMLTEGNEIELQVDFKKMIFSPEEMNHDRNHLLAALYWKFYYWRNLLFQFIKDSPYVISFHGFDASGVPILEFHESVEEMWIWADAQRCRMQEIPDDHPDRTRWGTLNDSLPNGKIYDDDLAIHRSNLLENLQMVEVTQDELNRASGMTSWMNNQASGMTEEERLAERVKMVVLGLKTQDELNQVNKAGEDGDQLNQAGQLNQVNQELNQEQFTRLSLQDSDFWKDGRYPYDPYAAMMAMFESQYDADMDIIG